MGKGWRGFSLIEIMVVTALAIGLAGGIWGFLLPWFRVGMPARALVNDVQTIAAQLPGVAERMGGFSRRLPTDDSGHSPDLLARLTTAGVLDSRFVCAAECTDNPLGARYRHLNDRKAAFWPHSLVLEILLPDDDPEVDLDDEVVTRRKLVLDRLQSWLDLSPTMTSCRKDDDDDSLLYVRVSLTEQYHRDLVERNRGRLFGWDPALCVLP